MTLRQAQGERPAAADRRRGGRPRLIGAAATAAFLDGVRRGAALKAAAKAAGFSLSAFYHRRGRDPGFAADWDEAARAAAARFGKARRRPRFSARGRAAFLGRLAPCCDTTAAAAAAGVHKSAVYRRIARDPGFARANEAALHRGYERLEAEVRAERERSAARWRGHVVVPAGRPTQDFDEQIRLLDRYRRPPPPRRGRWLRPARSFEELVRELEVKLERRFRPAGGGGDGDA
jgi:hypothetical protein